jgi:hypothetical protein
MLELFSELQLESFDFITDQGNLIEFDYPKQEANKARYGCGLFLFKKLG